MRAMLMANMVVLEQMICTSELNEITQEEFDQE
jgi:hypothetical protein